MEDNNNINGRGRGRRRLQKKRYCVTGASGYIGSWLVKSLLQNGHSTTIIHATVRDPERSEYLLSKWNGGDRVKLFRADLHEEGSFDEAVKDCDGVFHVAAPMEFSVPAQDNIERYVQSKVINPAIKGTLNLLRSCLKSTTVKRVVFTSSISTMTSKDKNGDWIPFVDESCRASVHHVLKVKAPGWVYVLSKLLTEEAAFKFARDNGIDLVSVITTTVVGPFLTSNVPSSIRVLLSPITDDPELYPILKTVNSRMGSVCIVHVEDLCNAHIFLMEHPKAKGRYMCCARSCHISELLDHLAQAYPSPYTQRMADAKLGEEEPPSRISSRKLTNLGFVFEYGSREMINQTIEYCVECGYLPPLDD